ncbi:carbohydrate ABC transporter permease [Paenibacillus rhizoplanae]
MDPIFPYQKNTLWALILPNLLANGFNVLLVRNYFKNNVPLEIIEAAQIDGASELRTFFRIMLPLSMPVMATVGMFMGLAYWNDWINALYFVSKPQLYGIQNLLMQLMSNIQFLNSGQAGNVLGGRVRIAAKHGRADGDGGSGHCARAVRPAVHAEIPDPRCDYWCCQRLTG